MNDNIDPNNVIDNSLDNDITSVIEDVSKLKNELHQYIKENNTRYIIFYNLMVKGDARLLAKIKIISETVDRMKSDQRRYMLISASWLGWWVIHLLDKIFNIYH